MSDHGMRVVIADDHTVVRQGIRGVLEDVEGLEVVGEAGDGIQALALVEELGPDVVVLDVNMPGMTGLEVADSLREAAHPVRVLILSMHDDPEYVLQAGIHVLGVRAHAEHAHAQRERLAVLNGQRRARQVNALQSVDPVP